MTGNHDTTQPLETSLAVIPVSVLTRWHEYAEVAADPRCGAESQRVCHWCHVRAKKKERAK